MPLRIKKEKEMNSKHNVPKILKGILETNEDWLMERVLMYDRIEIGFCVEWAGESKNKSLEGLQINNRLMTNEKIFNPEKTAFCYWHL